MKVFSAISAFGSAWRRSLVNRILRIPKFILRNITRKCGFNVA